MQVSWHLVHKIYYQINVEEEKYQVDIPFFCRELLQWINFLYMNYYFNYQYYE